MPGRYLTLLLLAGLLFGCATQPPPPAPPLSREAVSSNPFQNPVFEGCYDGDSCTFNLLGLPPVFGDHLPVRLAGIDTPEIRGKCDREKQLALKARDLLNATLRKAERVKLLNPTRDKYFRLGAHVVADGQDLSVLLLEKGLAVEYDGGTKTHNWCEAQ
jgi:micrococcal nuclease